MFYGEGSRDTRSQQLRLCGMPTEALETWERHYRACTKPNHSEEKGIWLNVTSTTPCWTVRTAVIFDFNSKCGSQKFEQLCVIQRSGLQLLKVLEFFLPFSYSSLHIQLRSFSGHPVQVQLRNLYKLYKLKVLLNTLLHALWKVY